MSELKNKILDYILSINKYEKYIKEIYKTPIFHKCLSGYIINLRTYIELKNIIHYKDLNKFIKEEEEDNEQESLSNKIQKLIESEEIYEPKINIEHFNNKTSSEFIELINNRNDYLLINEEFWNILCKKDPKENVRPIDYYINYSKLVLILKDKNQMNFELNSKNILRKKSYIYTINYINDNLFDYAQSIVEYYIFENKIKNDLRNDDDFFLKEKNIGYLIEKEWIDKWKKNTFYEEIKNKYLENKLIDKDNAINNIINQILLFYKNKIKEINIEQVNIFNISKFDISTIFKYNSLAIVDSSFLCLFDNKNKFKENKYKNNYFIFSCKKGNIVFKENLIFNTNNNILLSSNEKDKDMNIKIMIRIFFFQIFLQQKIELVKKSGFKKVYMVTKEYIQKYKNNYKYESIYDILIKNYKLFPEITDYETLTDDILEKIINTYIPKELKDEISNIKDISDEDFEIKIEKEKNLEYISDFEFIPNDIIINKKCYFYGKYFGGEYCIKNKKIILIFDEKNYCEIGHIKKDLFIIEYIIENNKENDIKSFKENIFQSILKKSKIDGNFIKIGNNKYKIHQKDNIDVKEENEKHNLNDYNNKNIIYLILSSLISYFYWNKKINNFIENKCENRIFPSNYYYLINKDFLLEYKKIFKYEEISEFLKQINKNDINDINFDEIFEKYQNIYSSLIKKEIKEIYNLFENNEALIPQLNDLKENKIKYYNNFEIINITIFETIIKLTKFYNENIIINDEIKISPLSVSKDGKILIEHQNFNCLLIGFFNNNNNNVFFIIEKIINLLKLKKFLKILIKFVANNQKIKIKMEKKIEDYKEIKDIKEKKYYLVNQNWINKFKNLFSLDKNLMSLILKYFDIHKKIDINDKFNKILNELSINYIDKLNSIEQNNINELNNKNLYEIFDKKYLGNKSYFGLIDKEIINLLLENNIPNNIIEGRCLFIDEKIFIFISYNNEKLIKISILDELEEAIISQIIIKSENNNLDAIKKQIKLRGYKYIQDLCKSNPVIEDKKLYNIKILFIKDEVDKIEVNKNNKNLSKPMSIRLELLLILYQYQQKFIEKTKNLIIENIRNNNNKLKDGFLINKNWLCEVKYNEIKKIINENEKIKSLLNKNSSFDDQKLVPYFNEIENFLKNINFNKNFYLDKKDILILNNKIISIYNNFIIVNEKLKKLFIENFEIDNNIFEKVTYIIGDNKIFIINKNQHSILLGNIIPNENSFNLKYIFEYNEFIKLSNNLKQIFNNYQNYIQIHTIFNSKMDNSYISPIFENDNLIIGNLYKYKDKINYNLYKINEQVIDIILLCINNNELQNNLSENKKDFRKIYLANSTWLNKYKTLYKYDRIEQEFLKNKKINKNNNINLKSLYSFIIKNIYDINYELNKQNFNQNEFEININDIEITPVNYFNNELQLKQLMIYNNFEILDQKIIELLTFIKYDENTFFDCDIIGGYLIVHFPSNQNEEYISLLGILNYKNIFITKYILIYNKKSYRESHISILKHNIKNYLETLKLYNNSSPITTKNFKIIGTIIKFEKDNANLNINNNINNNTNNNFDFNNNDKKDNNYDNIRNNFKLGCPHIGLTNIGATCYMNSTLQCFCHIEKLVNYFKYKFNYNKTNNLSSSFKLLIESLWPNHKTYNYYAPEEFKNKISKMNPLFEGIAANDSKDLVNFIIMTLHEELNKANKNQINNTNAIIDQRNKNLVFQSFANSFMSQNCSIISDLFYGINCNITDCNCGSKIYNFQIYFFIIFPLEEVRKFKIQSEFNYNYNNMINTVSIYDCFNYDRKVNLMSGENSMYCNNCKKITNCCMYTNLVTGPEILILLLNRGKGIEFNVKINFVEYLNLENYIEYKNTGYQYRLIGVITHIGESSMSGHFIAYCLDPIIKKWYKYNDAIVNEVTDFQNEVINFAMPYLLFYQKII